MRFAPGSKSTLLWAGGVLILLALLWPLTQGAELRTRASQRLLDQGWNREYQVLPLLALAYNRSMENPADTSLLERVWPQMQAFKGNHPEFFWLTLSVLEDRAGRMPRAQEALQRARALDPKIINMVQGPRYADYRRSLGLGG